MQGEQNIIDTVSMFVCMISFNDGCVVTIQYRYILLGHDYREQTVSCGKSIPTRIFCPIIRGPCIF